MRVRPEVSELSERGRDPAQRLRGPGADHAARRDDGRARLRPELHDRRPAAQRAATTRSTARRSSATCRSSAPCSARTASARNETELVIVVTPYLVRPVSASQIALPTDGYRNANDGRSACCSARSNDGRSGEQRPVPAVAGAADRRARRRRGRQRRCPAPARAAAGRERAGAAALPPQQPAAAAQPGFNF